MRERIHSAELQALLRATPAAIWIATGPGLRRITGNPASYKFLECPIILNVSATSDPEILRTLASRNSGPAFPSLRSSSRCNWRHRRASSARARN